MPTTHGERIGPGSGVGHSPPTGPHNGMVRPARRGEWQVVSVLTHYAGLRECGEARQLCTVSNSPQW